MFGRRVVACGALVRFHAAGSEWSWRTRDPIRTEKEEEAWTRIDSIP